MDAMAAGRNISDEWEELSSDSFSVVSMPTSDADEFHHVPADNDQSPAPEAAPTFQLPIRTIAARPTFPPSSPSSSTGSPAGQPPAEEDAWQARLERDDSVGSQPYDALLPPYSDTSTLATVDRDAGDEEANINDGDAARPSGSWMHPAVTEETIPGRDSSVSENGGSDSDSEEVLDAQVDPSYLLSVVRSLQDVIKEALRHAGELVPADGDDLQEQVGTVCNLISGQLTELEHIVSGYSRSWPPRNGEMIPLDPGLQGWLSGVRAKLLRLQVELHKIIRGRGAHSELPLQG